MGNTIHTKIDLEFSCSQLTFKLGGHQEGTETYTMGQGKIEEKGIE